MGGHLHGLGTNGQPEGRSVGQVAKDFDLTETAVRDWVRQADIDAGVRSDGLTSAATSPGRACC